MRPAVPGCVWSRSSVRLSSRTLFSSAFRFSPDPIAISRRSDGHIIEANDRWLELLRYDRRQLARGELDPLEAHIDRADRAKFTALARNVVLVSTYWMSFQRLSGGLSMRGDPPDVGLAAYQVMALIAPYLEGEARALLDRLGADYL